MQLELDDLADIIASAVKAATEPLVARIATLEGRVAIVPREGKDGPKGDAGQDGATGPQGPMGPPGADADPAEIISMKAAIDALRAEWVVAKQDSQQARALVSELVAEKVAELPVPRDGRDADLETVKSLIDEAVTHAVASLPRPQDGAPGKDGQSVDPEVVASLVSEHVKAAIEQIPLPQDGKDGLGVAGALIDRDGHLVVTLSNGQNQTLGKVVGADGRDGAPGAPGPAGLNGTLENLKIERLSERTLQFQFKDGTPVEGGTIRLDHPCFKNLWVSTTHYEKSDVVQWGGGGYIALVDEPLEKPGTGPPERTGWKLWIKPGADGKQGKPGPIGERGPKGEKGDRGGDRWQQ